jgi:tRNA nucleotidyltransferase (CCA-adding enzyme)
MTVTMAAMLSPDVDVRFATHQFREIADIVRHPQTRAELLHQLDSRRAMAVVTRWHPEIDTGLHTLMTVTMAAMLSPDVDVRFATLCHDVRRQHRGHRDGHQGVQAGVDFRVPFGRGRHAVHLGKGLTPKALWPRHHGHGPAGVKLVEQLCARLRGVNAVEEFDEGFRLQDR